MGPKENEDCWVGELAPLREEKRSKERLLEKSIEGNCNLSLWLVSEVMKYSEHVSLLFG